MREGRRLCGMFQRVKWQGKRRKKEKKKKRKKSKGTCVEEVVGKKRKEANKEKKLRVRVWRKKEEGKKNQEIWIIK